MVGQRSVSSNSHTSAIGGPTSRSDPYSSNSNTTGAVGSGAVAATYRTQDVPVEGTSVRKKDGQVVDLPAGEWVFDTVSNYYWNEDRGVFWDVESEMFYNPDTEDWFY